MAVEGGIVSHHYILVIHKFIDCMSLFTHSEWFALPFNSQSLKCATYGL